MMRVGMMFPVGLVLGPATNALTRVSFDARGFRVSDRNAPGLLLALANAVFWVLARLVLREPPPYADAAAEGAAAAGGAAGAAGAAAEPAPESAAAGVRAALARPSTLLCFVVIFSFNFFITASEAVVTPTTDACFGFSPLQNSLVYAGVAAYILALTALVLATPARLKSDRGLVTLAAVVYLGGALAAGALWEYG